MGAAPQIASKKGDITDETQQNKLQPSDSDSSFKTASDQASMVRIVDDYNSETSSVIQRIGNRESGVTDASEETDIQRLGNSSHISGDTEIQKKPNARPSDLTSNITESDMVRIEDNVTESDFANDQEFGKHKMDDAPSRLSNLDKERPTSGDEKMMTGQMPQRDRLHTVGQNMKTSDEFNLNNN